ncbi:MAG: protein-disulfide reductase DsbD domain-containing protein [Pseudomonadota bacterium]
MIRYFLALVCALGLTQAVSATEPPAEHAKAELIAETTALLRGGDTTVALMLTPEDGWHTYWINPGDSGLATKLEWTLPEGVSAGVIQWPAPHPAPLGELTNYGYDGETLHMVNVSVPAGWPKDAPLTLKAKAKWLVCKDVCIPGSADLSLTLPVADTVQLDDAHTARFERDRALLPQPLPASAAARFNIADGAFSLALADAALPEARQLAFFPLAGDLVNHAAPQRLARSGGEWRLTQALSAYYVIKPKTVDGLWVLTQADGSRQSYALTAQPGAVLPVTAQASTDVITETPPAKQANNPGVLLALGLALLGGLILNLMPCVFPVLSLKALALLKSQDVSQREQRAQALAYTAGAVLSCVAAAGVLLALRAGGEALGWGFQLQSPIFIAVLAYVMLALGLSMSGVAEFGGSLMNTGSSLAQKQGLSGSFFTGVLAVVVASPCTAPFMGTALGFAVTQPVVIALAIFAALGLGLALPFLVLGFVPALARLLPRPGAWMLTFKQVMAFPLYLTAAWLLWVLTRQAGADALGLVLVGCVAVAFALWLLGRSPRGRVSTVFAVLALIAAAAVLASPFLKPASLAAVTQTSDHEPWSTARVEALRAEGKTIFVDFTADWCITCKVNERGALASTAVKQAFADEGVVSLVADWTRADPEITKALAAFGRNGVPLYLVYPKGGEPRVLPQVLTPGIVMDALKP